MIPNKKKPEIKFDSKARVFVKENALDPLVCDKIIEFGKANVSKGISLYPHLFDVSFHSCMLPLNNEYHTMLGDTWNEICQYLSIDADFIEPYELKRYSTGDFFDRHADNYCSHVERIDRKITLSIQLSDPKDYIGGDFQVLDITVPKSRGSIIAFPSFFSHSISLLLSGERWSLISWGWGKDFV